MLLGKRPRRPVSRTASLTELTFDLNAAEGERHQRPPTGTEGVTGNNSNDNNRRGGRRRQQQPHHVGHQTQQQHQYQHQGLWDGYLSSPPRNPRRYSDDYVIEQAHFLRACGLCKQRLGPGKDTFMYRGEVAFCSLECRQQQIIQDERKEKCSLVSMKRDPPQPPTKPEASGED